MYTGDTTIGLKGRIIFEAPGLIALLTAHRALEEAVLTKQQNRFKPDVARKWVELVYEGFLPRSAEDRPRSVPGVDRSRPSTATSCCETSGGSVDAVAVEVAAHPQRQGRDLRAGGGLGRGRGRRLHQAVRHELARYGRR